ncbi:hypothetical protein Aph01nite_34410 [Acrocarpospora phusangensis]|uniref:Uncharacterized protein n=1 Tax=Acrocarpospora phusangensis TaxID=1070424 RepID=A0A919QBT5_9ACTN|nr:hypothetical protein [Acrocarpospora phusangensis]GIH25131.1 hypothetical protein Aph01nite_34410 [Acrocarpospora phusangensis]
MGNLGCLRLARRILQALALAILAISLAGCGSYPEQHDERLRKAAGVVTFRITCAKDLWERTSKQPGFVEVKAKSVKDTGVGDSTVVVELSGAQLVDYLELLADWSFSSARSSDPLSERMYNAIAPVVDKISGPLSPGSEPPSVVVNDTAGGSTSTPITTPTPSTSR